MKQTSRGSPGGNSSQRHISAWPLRDHIVSDENGNGDRLLSSTAQIDHVLIAVSDLATSAREVETRYGLASLEGGRHPGWGTANRIVPLGDTYLELVSVVDEAEADQSVFGRWVANGAREPGRPIGWAVRTNEIDAIAQRLGLTVRTGSRKTPSGQILEWRSTGMEAAAAEPSYPFFIEWSPGIPLPSRRAITHPGGPAAIARILIHGDATRLAAWLGGQMLPAVVSSGEPGVVGIVLSREGAEIIVETIEPPLAPSPQHI